MNYDHSILLAINGLAGQWFCLDTLMVSVSKIGPLVFGIYLITLWFCGDSRQEKKKNREQALYAVCSALLALGVNQIIGALWFRERPCLNQPVKVLMTISQDSSFPSDHAAASFSIAGSAMLGQKFAGVLLMAFATLVAVSRIYVGAHYPSDVIGGLIIGLLSSWIVERNQHILKKLTTGIINVWEIVESKLSGLDLENRLTK